MMRDDLFNEISQLPAIDVHSHLRRDQMAATDLGKVMFYHMLAYPLRSAGAPGARMWQPGQLHWRGREEDLPYDAWIEHWAAVSNTGFAWILRTILRDLYGFDEPVTRESLPRLKAAFLARAAQPGWAKQVLGKAGVVRILSSSFDVAPLAPGQYGGGIRFTMEAAPTSGTHEYVSWKQRLERWGQRAGREITSFGQMAHATQDYFDKLDWSGKNVLVNWLGSEADFRPAGDSAIDAIIADAIRGAELPPDSARLLEAAFVRCMLRAVRGRIKTFQLVYGTQFPTQGEGPGGDGPHAVAKAASQFATSLGFLVAEFPDIHFNILNGYEIDEPLLCALCLGYNNVSLGSFWWQTFYPSVMHAAWHRRLDMVPVSRLCGFFSDGYSVDYIYGRLRMTELVLAGVLAEKIERGFCTREQALQIARDLLFETPRRLFLPDDTCESSA